MVDLERKKFSTTSLTCSLELKLFTFKIILQGTEKEILYWGEVRGIMFQVHVFFLELDLLYVVPHCRVKVWFFVTDEYWTLLKLFFTFCRRWTHVSAIIVKFAFQNTRWNILQQFYPTHNKIFFQWMFAFGHVRGRSKYSRQQGGLLRVKNIETAVRGWY